MVNDQKVTPQKTENMSIEKHYLAYQVAIGLWSSRANELWSQFYSVMTANSIVVASVTLTLTQSQARPLWTLGMSVAGLSLCILWLMLHARGSGYTNYWPLTAREIEEKYFDDDVKIFSRGGEFASGKPIDLIINGEIKTIRMNRLGRILKVEWIAYLVIIIFSVLYCSTLIYSILLIC